MEYQQDLDLAKSKKVENKQFLQKLKKVNAQRLDNDFHQRHDEVFEEIDCLKCANCCSTTSPIFTPKDIERLSKYFKMKPGTYIEQYLKIDSDNDYVLQLSPCPFLMPDNYCVVYDHRPKACREFPHTNRKRMSGILKLTYNNTMVCPAVARIVEQMKMAYNQ